MDNRQNSLLDSGLGLAAITSFLYCASAAYTGGFLRQLGLDSDVLDRNFQQILYHGFVISFGPVLTGLAIYTVCRFAYSHAILPEVNDALRHNLKRKRRFLKLKFKLLGKRKDSDTEKREKRHSIKSAFLLTIFFALILSLAHFESKGKALASSVYAKLDSKSIPDHEMVTVSINGQSQKLLYLMCGARNCAGAAPDTKLVHYFPQNGHSSVLSPAELLEQTHQEKPAR
ncbi:hypothetical protein U737_00090 [Methylomonas sp. LW13]|uniref:hypothetical protein n=1 Tax=unclassified Methylomonas TaxID=2608980 RepID=UPI00051B734B|nr:hypothetical protein [Methylomonas sp. LW13]QBC25436.1 hypothetical protein U737_00090 [Methylomonas sp. LW13]